MIKVNCPSFVCRVIDVVAGVRPAGYGGLNDGFRAVPVHLFRHAFRERVSTRTIEYTVGGLEYCAVRGKAAMCVSSRRYGIRNRKRPLSLVWNQQVSVKPNGQDWPSRNEYSPLYAPA
jgi:hypothetical protein